MPGAHFVTGSQKVRRISHDEESGIFFFGEDDSGIFFLDVKKGILADSCARKKKKKKKAWGRNKKEYIFFPSPG